MDIVKKKNHQISVVIQNRAVVYNMISLILHVVCDISSFISKEFRLYFCKLFRAKQEIWIFFKEDDFDLNTLLSELRHTCRPA